MSTSYVVAGCTLQQLARLLTHQKKKTPIQKKGERKEHRRKKNKLECSKPAAKVGRYSGQAARSRNRRAIPTPFPHNFLSYISSHPIRGQIIHQSTWAVFVQPIYLSFSILYPLLSLLPPGGGFLKITQKSEPEVERKWERSTYIIDFYPCLTLSCLTHLCCSRGPGGFRYRV